MRIRHFAIASALSLAALVSAAPNALAQQAEAMKYCKADVARLCPGVQMGGGRIIACLKEHKEEMSIGCGKALQAMKGEDGRLRTGAFAIARPRGRASLDALCRSEPLADHLLALRPQRPRAIAVESIGAHALG